MTVSIGQAESYFRINTKANTVVDLTEKVSTSTNYYNAKIENSSELETLLGITAEEKAQGVNVWADVQNNNYMPPVNKNLINSVLGDYTVGQYLNISLYKKVGNNSATLVSDTNEKVKISINIPESLWGSNRVYGVVGVHNGVPQFLGGTYEESTHKLTFETNGFSPYAIAYKSVSASTATTTSVTQGASATVTEAANYGTPGVSAGTTVKAPKTEDCTSVMMWYMLLLIAGGLLLVSFKSNKR